jgi:hypothetical protein
MGFVAVMRQAWTSAASKRSLMHYRAVPGKRSLAAMSPGTAAGEVVEQAQVQSLGSEASNVGTRSQSAHAGPVDDRDLPDERQSFTKHAAAFLSSDSESAAF